MNSGTLAGVRHEVAGFMRAFPRDFRGRFEKRRIAPKPNSRLGVPICEVVSVRRLAALLLLLALPLPAFCQLRVVSSTTDLAAIALEVGGPLVTVEALCRGGQDPHSFDLLPGQVLSVKRASVFLRVGLELDPWVEDLIAASDNTTLQVTDCSIGIEVLGTRAEEAGIGQHVHGNPHYWLGPTNLPIIARTITRALSLSDPEHATEYERNLAGFADRVDSALARWREVMKPCTGVSVVTHHPTWDYLARDLEFRIAGTVEVHAGVEPSPVEMARLQRTIRDRKVKVLLQETFTGGRISELLAKDGGLQIVTLPSSVGALPECPTLWSLFDVIVLRLASSCRSSHD